MKEFLSDAVLAAKASDIRVFSTLAKETNGCVSLTLGEPDGATPKAICRTLDEAIQAGETHYIANSGKIELRQAISENEKNRYGLSYAPDEILVTDGATEALFVALFGILNPGDEVIIPTPAFVLYKQLVGLCRATAVPMDLSRTGYQIDETVLQSLITEKTKAIILNSPNNPTGTILTKKSHDAVRRAIENKPIFIITDDVYRDLCYARTGVPLFAADKSMRGRTIVVNSYSKPYAMTGWRLGWLMSDKEICSRLALVHQYTVTSTPSLFQRAGQSALHCDPKANVPSYKKRRDFAVKRLTEMGLSFPSPDGAFYLFPDISCFGLNDRSFCTRMIKEAGVAAIPGSCFGGDGHIRISYCVDEGKLAEGLDRMESFIRLLGR